MGMRHARRGPLLIPRENQWWQPLPRSSGARLRERGEVVDVPVGAAVRRVLRPRDRGHVRRGHLGKRVAE